jgi:glycosyltransferase involved in cell wall biosynthesis
MKVLFVNHFPLEGSGSGTYTGNIAQYLTKNGHEACIIFPENTKPAQEPGLLICPVYFSGDAPISDALPYNFPCFTTHPRSNTTFSDLSTSELSQYLAAFDKAISETIRTFRPDIIHAQHIWCLSYLISKYTAPFVITTHGTDLMGYEKWPKYRQYADMAVNKCARIIAISKDNYQSTIKTFPQAANKTLLMSNGYNDGIFYIENIDRLLDLK